METRRIVVPSRKRPGNIPKLLQMIPTATICVAKSERADYAAVVPKGQLMTHPNVLGLPRIRNWLNANVQEDCLVAIDDDLKGIRPLIGKQKIIRDPLVIARAIDNAHRVCEDLGIGVFCWSRTRNTFLAEPDVLPVRFVQPVSCSFGLRGPARSRQFDPDMPGRADMDFTLQTLLEDRILLADMRWYFDHGRIFSGKGGNVGLLTHDQWEKGTAKLYAKWGRFIGRTKPGFAKSQGNVSPASIRVKRMNPLAKSLD